MKSKSKHGGARKGAGQKPKYGEATQNVTFRLPVSQVQRIRGFVAEQLEKFKEQKIETQSDVKAKKTWTLEETIRSGPALESVKIKFSEPVILGDDWVIRNEATGFHWKAKAK